MRYMGSKRRIANDILAFILPHRKENQYFVDLFMGGCNVVDKIGGNRIANDLNPYLVAMFDAVVNKGFDHPIVTEQEYKEIRANKEAYEKHLVGWVGFGCSYRSKWFGGYSGKNTSVRDYANGTKNMLLKQASILKGTKFTNQPYYEVELPPNSLVYCDPPYLNTTQYDAVEKFDHERFYNWIRDKVKEGHKIWISEYSMPDDFICIKEWNITSEMHHSTEKKKAVEKLFIHKSQMEIHNPLTLF